MLNTCIITECSVY